jgi:hypothetical protein
MYGIMNIKLQGTLANERVAVVSPFHLFWRKCLSIISLPEGGNVVGLPPELPVDRPVIYQGKILTSFKHTARKTCNGWKHKQRRDLRYLECEGGSR